MAEGVANAVSDRFRRLDRRSVQVEDSQDNSLRWKSFEYGEVEPRLRCFDRDLLGERLFEVGQEGVLAWFTLRDGGVAEAQVDRCSPRQAFQSDVDGLDAWPAGPASGP